MNKTKQTARKSTTQIPVSLRNRMNRNQECQSNPANGSNKTQSNESNTQPDDKQPNAGSNDKQSK